MPDHLVNLTYTLTPGQPANFSAAPFSLPVKAGDTIGFQLAGGATGTIRITFRDRRFFSAATPHFHDTGVFHHGDGNVTVSQAVMGVTTYHCQLLDGNGNVIAESRESGGEIIPSTS